MEVVSDNLPITWCYCYQSKGKAELVAELGHTFCYA